MLQKELETLKNKKINFFLPFFFFLFFLLNVLITFHFRVSKNGTTGKVAVAKNSGDLLIATVKNPST